MKWTKRAQPFQRLGSALLAILVMSLIPLTVSAETLEEIQAQQDQLQAENQELQVKLDSLREDEAQKQAYQDTLQQQIRVVQEQILTTRENIDDLNASIRELTLKLDASREAVQDTIDQFRERLVALYTAGNVSTLEVLLDSQSLSDFPPVWNCWTTWLPRMRNWSLCWRAIYNPPRQIGAKCRLRRRRWRSFR